MLGEDEEAHLVFPTPLKTLHSSLSCDCNRVVTTLNPTELQGVLTHTRSGFAVFKTLHQLQHFWRTYNSEWNKSVLKSHEMWKICNKSSISEWWLCFWTFAYIVQYVPKSLEETLCVLYFARNDSGMHRPTSIQELFVRSVQTSFRCPSVAQTRRASTGSKRKTVLKSQRKTLRCAFIKVPATKQRLFTSFSQFSGQFLYTTLTRQLLPVGMSHSSTFFSFDSDWAVHQRSKQIKLGSFDLIQPKAPSWLQHQHLGDTPNESSPFFSASRPTLPTRLRG